MRRSAAALALTLAGCAYYNGVYNAKAADRAADRLKERGQDAAAESSYRAAASKAESVLARYPRSRWRADALYLAGRGAALGGQCGPARPRLVEFLALPRPQPARRERAAIALASCAFSDGRYVEARRLAEPLLRSADRRVARDAALWSARAAAALGDRDAATRYLAAVDSASAEWEWEAEFLADGDYAGVESLLTRRASGGDFRPEVLPALTTLWHAGRRDGVRRVVDRYVAAPTPSRAKARVHLLAADLEADAANDSAVHTHLAAARRLATDSIVSREIAARLTQLSLASLSTVADVEDAIVRGRATGRGSALQQRLEEDLLLLKILAGRVDAGGSSLFLAAEVARDSLRAPRLAHLLFRRLADGAPAALLAPKALLAAAALLPDSAERYEGIVRARYSKSPYALLLDGGDPSELPTYKRIDAQLLESWTSALRAWSDTVDKLRVAASPTMAAEAVDSSASPSPPAGSNAAAPTSATPDPRPAPTTPAVPTPP